VLMVEKYRLKAFSSNCKGRTAKKYWESQYKCNIVNAQENGATVHFPITNQEKPVSSSLPFNSTLWKTCGFAPPILLHIFQHLGGGQTDDR
jgi:hypothetical protein